MPQDQHPATPWSQNMHHDSLGANGEEDFTRFLDLDNGFDQFQQIEGGHAQSSLETPMGRLAFGHNDMQDLTNHGQEIMQTIDMSQFQPYQVFQQMNQSMQYQVPPTPVSAEMHAAKYTGQIDNAGQIIFDRHQNSFTPLVSPAQTPLDNAFGVPDYMMGDEFFSPITSPAIEAQHNFASTNTTASPIDLSGDQSLNHAAGTGMRRRQRKINTPQPRPIRGMKQSPAMKPQQKRRQISLTATSHDKLEAMLEGREDRLQVDASHGNTVFPSSEDSVSPEPLSEALMRPPPVPSNIGRPTSILQSQPSRDNIPATPAMIMRMPGKAPGSAKQAGSQGPNQDVMEDIALPDAAATLPSRDLPQINTNLVEPDDQTTPTLPAKTPKLSADSTPRTSAIRTQNNSSESVDKIKRPDTRLGGRGNKKRQSDSSAAISPALRPKISPSISPLVPATGHGMNGLTAETSALYLASKSNYQNILDGTHLPGVTYPETLAENLSSKRTSHKIAEQGRRNRINLALKEIESLLPASITACAKKEKSSAMSKDSEEGSPGKLASAAQSASKASTVEMAIVYIRSLQAELKETKQKLEAAEKKAADDNSSDGHSSTPST